MNDYDVVIVGGGLAGSIAALSAAQTAGNPSVGLVTNDETSLSRASGLVDVLGYTSESDGPIANPFDHLSELPPSHPYATVGRDALRAGLGLFDEVAGDAYGGGSTDQNALVPTQYGTLKPTARYPAGVQPGLASEKRMTVLVGFERLTGMHASLVASRLMDRVPYTVNSFTVRFPVEALEGNPGPRQLPLAFADALDRNPETDAGHSLREALVRRINLYLNVEERIGLPAVLGLTATAAVREYLQEAFGVKVFEVPMGPPSVPGYRLQALLDDALERAGVDVRTGWSVVDIEDSGEVVETLTLEHSDTPTRRDRWQASAFVLASGGVLSGGIETSRQAVTEPLFGCHVDAPSGRDEWVDTDALGRHPFARFGVSTDRSLRPLTAAGAPEYDNLHAAGNVLGGYDFAAEQSGSGVSIATGYTAGRHAAEDH